MQTGTTRHAPPPAGKQLRLLSLDGGGVRGLSSLLILKKLMEMIDPDDPPKPCDYFDMIGGTSTGGLIAIMLGRLQMNVQDCIDEYKALFSNVFKKIRHRVSLTGKTQGRFDHRALENGIKEVVRKKLGDPDALFRDSSHRGGCKTFVCATSKDTSETIVISSYYSDRRVNDLREIACIWEVARATSAAMTFFDPMQLGDSVFLDGGTGANNPVQKLWEEAQDMFSDGPEWKLEENLLCCVSIGTGLGHLKSFGESVLGTEIIDALVAITTNTEAVAETFHRSHQSLFDRGLAYRFNVEQGLEEVGLESAEKVGLIEEATRRYITLEKHNSSMRRCKGQLVQIENNFIATLYSLQSFRPSWEQWETLDEPGLARSYIPHTTAYTAWLRSKGFIACVKPPKQARTTAYENLAKKITTHMLRNNPPKQSIYVLHFDCSARNTDVTRLFASVILQLLSYQLPSKARVEVAEVFRGAERTIPGSPGPCTLFENISLLFRELIQYSPVILQQAMVTLISHLRGTLVIAVDDVEALTLRETRADRNRDMSRELLVTALLTVAATHKDTYIILVDTVAVKRPNSPFSAVPIHQVRWDTEMFECLQCLNFGRRETRQREIVEAVPGTTDWFWNHPTYISWRERKSGILWIQGKPGSGKSVLAKDVVNPPRNNQQDLHSQTALPVCEWYYTTRGGSELMAHLSLLRSLLYQLLDQDHSLFDHFKEVYRVHDPGSNDWIIVENLKLIFSSIVAAGTRALCLVDAMDEAEDDSTDAHRKHILAFFASNTSGTEHSAFKFLVLSRPEHDIERFFYSHSRRYDDLGVIKLQEANKDAIRIIVDVGIDEISREMDSLYFRPTESSTRSGRNPKRRRKGRDFASNSDIEEIKRFLCDRADGVILWVTVAVATLKSMIGHTLNNWQEVRQELEEVPSDLMKLYKKIVEDLCKRWSHDTRQLMVARRILMWTLGANQRHPLRIVELHEAISLREEDFEFTTIPNFGWEDFRYKSRRYCGPFIDIINVKNTSGRGPHAPIHKGDDVQASRFDTVQLLHRTAKDFLGKPECAGDLHFKEADASQLVENALHQYEKMIEEFPVSAGFKKIVRALRPGEYSRLSQYLVAYLDERGLLLHMLARESSHYLRQRLGSHFISHPLLLLRRSWTGLAESGVGLTPSPAPDNVIDQAQYHRLKRSFEASWFGGTPRDESHVKEVPFGIAMLFGEYIYVSCFDGYVTAMEIILQLLNEFGGDDRDGNLTLFNEIIHAMLLAAVENGIEDLSYTLANMSYSIQMDMRNQRNGMDRQIFQPHKLWVRIAQEDYGNTIASRLELKAAESGNKALLGHIEKTNELIINLCTDPRIVGISLGPRSFEVFSNPSKAEVQDTELGDIRMALEMGIYYLKLSVHGFPGTIRPVCGRLCPRVAWRMRLDRAFTLYRTQSRNDSELNLMRSRATKKCFAKWLSKTSFWYKQVGLVGVVNRVLQDLRRSKRPNVPDFTLERAQEAFTTNPSFYDAAVLVSARAATY